MTAVAFRPVEISQGLSLIFDILTFWFLVFVATYFAWRTFFGGRSFNEKESEKQLRKLSREWCENGIAISDWVRIHLRELDLNQKATISNPEFQELLWRDFEIYEKLIILDPKLKEDPIANEGRDFYGSLIRTENQEPS